MRSLQTMHEAFGRNFGASLSALLRTIVEIKLTSVDQLTYSEFVFNLRASYFQETAGLVGIETKWLKSPIGLGT